MSENFPVAPLVELTAELRWRPPRELSPSAGLDAHNELETFYEPFYELMRKEFAQLGFVQSERLIPRGFPTFPGQGVYRYSSLDQSEEKVVFSLTPGSLVISALPPYKNWETFRPFVAEGIAALERVWGSEESRPSHFNYLALRYVDSFDERFLEGKARWDFFTQSLGFGVTVPEVIRNLQSADDEPDVFIQYSIPVDSERELSISAGHATVANQPSVVFDMTLVRQGDVDADATAALTHLDDAHSVTNGVFTGLVQPILPILRGEVAS